MPEYLLCWKKEYVPIKEKEMICTRKDSREIGSLPLILAVNSKMLEKSELLNTLEAKNKTYNFYSKE